MRYLGMTDLGEIDRMTFRDYRLRMKAYELRRLDHERDIAWQAWCNLIVRNTKGSAKNPRPAFRTFDDFFDFRKEEKRILDRGKPQNTPMTRWQEFMRLSKDGQLQP